MARTVDPERHRARRLQIIDAALTRFAADGFDRATTASICREAGISSGTLFHYFPTKLSLLLAILALGTDEETAWFTAQEGRRDALAVVLDRVAHTAAEAADPRLPGFVRAVGAVMGHPEVAAALEAHERSTSQALLPWVRLAQRDGEVRADLTPERLTAWVRVVLDGYLSSLAGSGELDATAEQATLVDVVRRLLQP